MTLGQVTLILGPTRTATFRSFLVSTLGKTDNGQTYAIEDLNAHVKANHPKGFKDKN